MNEDVFYWMEITDPIDPPFSYNGSMHCAFDHYRLTIHSLRCYSAAGETPLYSTAKIDAGIA